MGRGEGRGAGRGGDDDDDAADKGPDTRYDWIAARIRTSLKVKDDVTAKLMEDEAAKIPVVTFLDDPECMRLIVLNEKELVATNTPPGKFKKKSCYFVKLQAATLANDDMDKLVIAGDFNDTPLEQLSMMSQEVFLPILCNLRNQEGWPEVITKEVVDNLHKFIANMYVTIGDTKGKTLLPLPPADAKKDEEADQPIRDKDRIHMLESAVVTWSRQIKNVLKLDPEAALKDGNNPGPLVELEFWAAKAANLNSIHEQLSGEKIQKVVRVLELTKSTYFPAFNRLCKEVDQGRVEANNNVRFLKPLRPYFEKLSMMDDFAMMNTIFKPMMHILLLIWTNSKFYTTAPRLVILMREMCNDLIMQACKFVEPEEILKIEPEEAVEKLRVTLKVCGQFKSFYFDYKQRTATEVPANPWKFQNSALFARLDSFLERCHDILDLTMTVLQFNKLERIEIGGTKGKTLTTSVRQIHSDFVQAVSKFQEVTYDILDVEVKAFDDDFYEFRCVIKELERRLGSVIIQAFDDCVTVGMTFKLLDSFEGLLDREIIKSDLEKKYADLLSAFSQDLKVCRDLYNKQSAEPPLNRNSPHFAGSVFWARGLAARVLEPYEKTQALAATRSEGADAGKSLESEELREIDKVYTGLKAELDEYEKKAFDAWVETIEATSEEKLKLPLLEKDERHGVYEGGRVYLRVNFDPAIVRLLREVKYFLLLKIDVPESAAKTYERAETFRQQTGNLDLIVTIYNGILKTLLPVEAPLVEDKLAAIDAAMEKGLTSLTWNGHKIEDYITELMALVKELNSILETIKNNVIATRKILDKWEANVMFERKDGKVYQMEEFRETHRALTATRVSEVQDGGKEIGKLLSASNKILKAAKGSPPWKAYVEYINDIVIDGFSRAILSSIKSVYDEIEPGMMEKNEVAPLIEIELELVAPVIQWQPELSESSSGDGVRDAFNSWIKGFLNIGTLMKRLDINDGNYEVELEEDYFVADSISEIVNVVLDNERRCQEFREGYMKYEFLWSRDLQQSLAEFIEENGKDGEDPELTVFDAEIQKYKKLQEEISHLPMTHVESWIKINAKPVKQALGTWVTKWIFLFTSYLSNKVVESMRELYEFMAESNGILDKEINEEEIEPENLAQAKKDLLYELMRCMLRIRKRLDKTAASFGPLADTVELLKGYGIAVNESTVKQLDEAPMAWEALSKKMLNIREKLSNQQQLEAMAIRDAGDAFQQRVEEYRAEFQKLCPFVVKGGHVTEELVETAYKLIDHYNKGQAEDPVPGLEGITFVGGNVHGIQADADKLNENQDLFEIYVVDYVALRRCKEEIQYLKNLWDMLGLVAHTFKDWNTTLWDKIDVETLVDEGKKISKEIKGLNKAVRNYDSYKVLEESVKAMLTSLPLVSDLHHPAMRERHWQQLMVATGKHFVKDEKFNLGDLLALELHQCVDAVGEIVDRAQKELIIEKTLKKIEETWAVLQVDFVPYEGEMLQLTIDDTVTEALENDNLQLQNLSGNKYVLGNESFAERVSAWQGKLGAVDSVLTTWQDVQKKWQMLESVFIGSADIRVQLPEDSKRFDGTNAEFKGLMTSAPDITNAVDACNLDGRQEALDKMLNDLELCEKALQDYLETKKVAFPRFYFVSNADLLDILSKGSHPPSIQRHMSKVTANTAKLELKLDEKGEPLKMALGMYSGEKEYVAFSEECSCDGAVEFWLQTVIDVMRKTLSAQFKSSIPRYDEIPRTKWLFEDCCQITVLVSRVFFTQEVDESFDQLEEGNDNALKDELQRQFDHLSGLVDLINGELAKLDRKKIMTLCTIDVHARDVMQRLIDERCENAACFQWQSQLRYKQNEKNKEAQINICDAEVMYDYEYIGNCGCLVITQLTDRCYITLTQAQRLVLGGAPAGPAGTGKTETTKDLSRWLGLMIYVFNCSDQMDYKAMGSIYKGLAQSGAWGCFDEFNRIPVAVLSVCSTQYKTVLDAIRAKKEKFLFEDQEIKLTPTTMAFITMNPGYPGRAELPESLKALFRPVSMVVPDLQNICEIMLMAEGFHQSKILARKFVILYKLCEDLLSKSAHYDWKLRAIKTTLYVAGGLKRDQPHLTEDKVLLQALRDFNLGKLTSDDTKIFVGLMNDLFPRLMEQVPRRVDKEFEAKIKDAAIELKYQPEDMFCLKITQLREIFEVRWSVFLLGPAGCGKTAIWRTLAKAQNSYDEKTVARPVNPKAVTRNELYGFLHPSTREWKEGLLSVTFRDFSNNQTNKHQWIVLDGDIDAEWIESMNTVMDDNKMLTLASNERIPLTATMRLLLEINHMIHCSPATVSRGGVIFVNAEDIGWGPVVDSWVHSLEAKEYVPMITEFFSRYMERSLDHVRRNFRTVLPAHMTGPCLPSVNIAMSVCKILEAFIPKESVKGAPPPDKKLVEMYFNYACVWALGGALLVDKVVNFRVAFSKWWTAEFKNVKFPNEDDVFGYFVDPKQMLMVPWTDVVPEFTYTNDLANFANMFVPTVESTRLSSFLDGFIQEGHYAMFVGNAGTGKTALMNAKLKSLDAEHFGFSSINMHSFLDAPALQIILENPLEKKSGHRYGPPGSRRLVYFIDDANMPAKDKYDTQSPIEIARQYIDYKGWFDKVKIVQKEVLNSQMMACMNPTSGTFVVTPRFQRHFVTFAVQMPTQDIIRHIYGQIIEGHFSIGFDPDIVKLDGKVADATIELHKHVLNTFLPSSVKFMYQFNLRELTNITNGICRATPEHFSEPINLVRLWCHEVDRVFCDRLTNETDIVKYHEIRLNVTKKYFEEFDMEEVQADPNIFVSFLTMDNDDNPVYAMVSTMDKLRTSLESRLNDYNESNAAMNLVLFIQACEHITRIARILDLGRGHAMLVGVGGSGKQSLARLATFICGYDCFTIQVTGSYGIADFKENLLNLYTLTGVKGNSVVLLLTDNQIVKEPMLVYLNDLMSSGFIPDLFSAEDKENFSNAVRNECKQAGIMDTPDNLFAFFIDKVRRLLHVCLCFSPVGDKFRIRARNFPALVNCMTFDYFQPWPHEALVSVANRFLNEIPNIDDETRESIAYHMAFVHQSSTEAAVRFMDMYRRPSYTTPKSYLELIAMYKELLGRKREKLRMSKERLENGLDKIAAASAQVADLQVSLKQEQIIVAEKKEATDKLIVSIGVEKEQVDAAVESGRGDEEECAKIAEEVKAFQDECAEDLKAAEPIIAEAEAALNSLDKKALGELKSFGSPAAEIVQVAAACAILTAPGGKIPKDLSWNASKKMMGNVDGFLNSLINFDKDNTPENCVAKVEKEFIANPNYNKDYIMTKSSAAAGLCAWTINICKYFRIYQVVAPKRALLAEANKKLDNANHKLAGIRAKVKELQDRVANLEEGLMKATEDKNAAIQQAEKTQRKADLADRLINGLAGENKRWKVEVEQMGVQEGKLVGDSLLASCFVSYVGPFNMQFRDALVAEKWLPDLIERQVPMTEGVEVLDVLSDDATRASWANEGLPGDPLSIMNGAIMTNAARYPLMIDPQLQGIKWIMNRFEARGLRIIQLSQAKYLDAVIHSIENGVPLLIENIGDDIEAVLDPVVGRMLTKRGRNTIVKIGDAEVEWDPNFHLVLQTKLSNPHYKPEINAQCTLINFTVTEKGLEDQLLDRVVEFERPDLQEQSKALVKMLGDFTIQLAELEDTLLFRLANSQGDILEDIELIEGIEETKRTVDDINVKTEEAKETEKSISVAREVYRPVAARGSLVYFMIDSLNILDRVYQYSMANFLYFLNKGMQMTPGAEDESHVPPEKRLGQKVDLDKRVALLLETTMYQLFLSIANGLFERHKLIVATQLTMMILKSRGELPYDLFDYLLRGPKVLGAENPLREWIPDSNWASVQSLRDLGDFSGLPDDLVGSAKRWREWIELERPEDEPFPGDWKKMPPFQGLLLFRALRPDRLTNAMASFVKQIIGEIYVTSVPFNLPEAFKDISPGTPCFIFLSPGVDVAAAVESLGTKLGFSYETGKYASVSLGQGQEQIAMDRVDNAHKNGGWVLLQNLHLTIDWTSNDLNKRVDKLADGAHEDFRLFLSAEPPPILERGLPISLLQNSYKLTNEPPEGMNANLRRAWGYFSDEMFESCAKQAEFKSIVFALCYYHSAMLERKKFGVGNLVGATNGIGWNMNYPFNTGDLLCCAQCASNYLENNQRVPWDDLRYIFGEIMYGGHIVEDWDRRLSFSYLMFYFNEALLEGVDMFPGFHSPSNTLNHKQTNEYILEKYPAETPLAFGLHVNAEIGFRLREAESLCGNILSLQPREAGGGGGVSMEDKAKMVLDDVIERLPDQFDMEEIRGKAEDITPYVMVAFQESERMNVLLAEMKRSLAELDLGLKGDLTMSEAMESVMKSLANDAVPGGWGKLSYPSLRPLGSWLFNLLARCAQLNEWTADLSLPKVVWLSGLFNPQSFLTAVMQTTARRNDWPLDKTVVLTDVTRKQPDQIEAPSRDGAFVHGLTLEGARWDDKTGVLEDSRPKELFCSMPVILIKAVTVDKAEVKDAYQTPVYKTECRFREEVFTAQLKSKAGQIKWTLAGVCLFLDVTSM